MTGVRRRIVMLTAIALTAGCSSDSGPEWYDLGQDGGLDGLIDVLDGEVVFDRDGIRVVQVTAGADAPCSQVVVDGVANFCAPGPTGAGGYSAQRYRSGGERIIEVRAGSSIRSFVVWSSHSPDGDARDPIRAGRTSILVWRMQPGEAPWGVQIVEADGTLGSIVGFTGLPAE